MITLVRRPTAGLLLCALMLLLGACGKNGASQERPAADRGGTLTMLAASDVDFLDPGHTYYALGIQVALATQRPLYGFRPGDLSQQVPDLASGPPAISADGRTITVRIRSGVRFSPPVGREVTSHDVAYAFNRFFSVNVGGQYPGYFADLIGAPPKPTDGVHAIRGISTPDPRTIVFHLRKPSAATFVGALTLPASAPVPEEYAKPFDAKNPSTYNTHVVATGPYMVRNDRQGETVGYQAGRQIELVRNPSWDRATDRRPAHLNEVLIRTNATDSNIAARQVLAGSHKVLDATPPPSVLKDVSEHHQDQAVRLPMGGYRFLPLNTTIKPFDKLDVRKAVLAGFDRQAARQARGGPITGPLATHFLPPGIPGFEEAGGPAGPGDDFVSLATPRGNPALAAKYMRQAGYPSGRYTGDERFLVVAGTSPSEKLVVQVVQSPAREARVPHPDALRAGRRALHRLVHGAVAQGPDLRQRPGVAQGLPGPAADAATGLRRHGDRAGQQLQLLAARRSCDQRRDGEGRLSPRRRSPPGMGTDRPHDRGSGGRRPAAVGGEHADPLQGRRRGAERLLRQLGSLLHVAEVAGLNDEGPPSRAGLRAACG